MSKLRRSALALLFGLLAGPALAQNVTTIGVPGPMTGGQATFGRQMKSGAEQAIADINAAGGVLGHKLAIDIEDDACDPKQARSVAEKLAGMRVPVAIGHYCSSSSIPASDAYLDGGVLQITPASTNPLFTERGMWNTFRTCGRDDQQGGFAADYLAKHFNGKNIAIINDKTTYGKGLADEVKKALNGMGVKEKLNESYNQGDKDFTALVSKLKLNGIDIVYDGGYHQEAGLIVRQMRDQGLTTILMAGDLEKAGRKAEADEVFRMAFALHEKLCSDFPRSPSVLNSAAWLSAGCRREMDKGLTFAARAVELAPEQASLLDTQAELHFQRGDKDKALELMQRCLKLEPRNEYYRKQLKRIEAGDPKAELPDGGL